MRKPAVRLLGLFAVLGMTAAQAGASGAASGPFSGRTPAQVLTKSTAAVLAKGSVHLVENTVTNGIPGRAVFDAGTAQGREVYTNRASGNAIILLTSPRILYVRGNATFIGGYGMTQEEATKYAGQWIAIPSSSIYFAGTATGLTVSSLMKGVTPSAPLGFSKPKAFAGKRAVGISGGPGPYAPSGSTGTQVLYISTAKPHLPAALVGQASFSGGSVSYTNTFSRYGARVAVKAPSNSVPISSILPPTP